MSRGVGRACLNDLTYQHAGCCAKCNGHSELELESTVTSVCAAAISSVATELAIATVLHCSTDFT